jgi:hypothetical protein
MDEGTVMIDYSESLIKIRLLRKKVHDAILDKKWDLAGGYADDLLVASRELKIWILDQEPL